MTTEPAPPEGLEEIIPPWLITGFKAYDAEIAESWRIFKGWTEEEEEKESKQSSAARRKATSQTSLSLDELEELIRRYPEIALAIAAAKQAELEAYLEQNVEARFAYLEHQAELLYLIGQLSQQEAFGEVRKQAIMQEETTREAANVIIEAVETQTRELQGFLAEPIAWFADRLESLLTVPVIAFFRMLGSLLKEEESA